MAYSWSGDTLSFSVANDITAAAINQTLLEIELRALEPFSAALQHSEVTGDVGKLFYNSAPSAGDKTSIQTEVTNHSGVVTSRNWQKVENNSIQEKDDAGFDTFLTLNCTPLAAGKYRFGFNGEARVKSGGGLTSQPKFRMRIDGATKATRTLQADLEWDGRCAWDFKTFVEGDTPVIILQMLRLGGSETIEMQRLKLYIEEMPE